MNGHQLKGLGFPSCKELGEALKLANEMETNGESKKAVESAILKMMPPPKLEMGKSKGFTEAIEIEGPYDEENLKSVRKLMNELMGCPVVLEGAVMPDACPAGSAAATIPVGGAIVVDNAIIPGAHSADICCSMYATFFESSVTDEVILDNAVKRCHFGNGGKERDTPLMNPLWGENINWKNPFIEGLEEISDAHMGTSGASNHFLLLGTQIVTQKLLNGLHQNHPDLWGKLCMHMNQKVKVLVTHHGSRNFGAQVYKRGVKVAERMTNKIAKNIPKACQWIPYNTQEGKDYWEALGYVKIWTKANHINIHDLVLRESAPIVSFGNEHNFVFKRDDKFYHGKGATPAWPQEDDSPSLGLIPINMKDGILLTLGKDNRKYLSFAPHGAGRNVSRTQTVKPFIKEDGEINEAKLEEALKKETEGIDVRWFSGKPDLSETPMGYKPAKQIIEQIEKFDLAEILGVIEPIG